ncbi:MAG: hypothetical protein WBP94_08955 [Rhodomicrobiaceae bacterium]
MFITMIMAPSIARTEQFSGALKSCLQYLRTMLAKQGATSDDHEWSTGDWDAFPSEALQQSARFSQEARERRAAIAQIMRSADVSTKISIADWLLFADDINEAPGAIIMRDQQRREAA